MAHSWSRRHVVTPGPRRMRASWTNTSSITRSELVNTGAETMPYCFCLVMEQLLPRFPCTCTISIPILDLDVQSIRNSHLPRNLFSPSQCPPHAWYIYLYLLTTHVRFTLSDRPYIFSHFLFPLLFFVCQLIIALIMVPSVRSLYLVFFNSSGQTATLFSSHCRGCRRKH